MGADSLTGRGLFLVDQIAHRWGVDIPGEPAAKRVWFELDVAPATWVFASISNKVGEPAHVEEA